MLTQAGKYIGSVIKKNREKPVGFYNYTQLFHRKLKARIFKFFQLVFITNMIIYIC